MAKHHPKPAQHCADSDDSATRQGNVEELIAKGREKEAFKQAKLYFHREASPENRLLVERTYVVRLQALIRGGMHSAGKEVASSLLEFGVKDPALLQQVVLLLPEVGLADKALSLQSQSPSPSSEVQDQLLLKLADRAVLHPEETPASLPELREAAGRVRSALAALDSDNETHALDFLQPIPRSSPLADWRYFVRGLIAFRKQDSEQAKSNWDRLDQQRAARKIAQTLLASSGQQGRDDQQGQLKALELQAFGEAVLDRLAELRRALETSDWKRALPFIGPLRATLHRINPRHSQRLTEIVLFPLSAGLMQQSFREAQRLLKEFTAALEPLSWDPHWNRFQAILWEGSQGSPREAIQHWRRYLLDLEKGVSGLPGELRQVQALVWRRIGVLSSDLGDEPEFGFFGDDPEDLDDESEIREQVVEALQHSLRLDPKQRKTYELLIEHYEDWDQPDHAIATLEALLKVFPDDVDALRRLLREHQLRDEPEPVLSCVERLRKLTPLDTRVSWEEAWGRLARARHLTLAKRWDDARAEFARVESSLKDYVAPYRLLSRRAAFEFKAGDAAQAEASIEAARASLTEPTPLFLALAIESVRYQLPKTLQTRFNRDLTKALTKKVTSETAGELAENLAGYFVSRVDYLGRATHAKEIVGYLRRTARTKYREPDLQHVCGFLQVIGEEDKLLTTLLKRGVKLFPSSPFFLLAEAQQDLRKGPMELRPQATQKKLEKALTLAEASQNPKDAELIPIIKSALARVRDAVEAMNSSPFGRGGMPGSFRDMFNAMLDRFGAMGPDDDDDGDGPSPSPKRKRK